MQLKTLQQHARTLATLPESETDVVSCYLSVENGRVKNRHALGGQPHGRGFTGAARERLEESLEEISRFLLRDLRPESKGVAIFSRTGAKPFFLPLQFRVTLPDWWSVDTTPNIYHLVELKDTYHRFVVVITTERGVRVLGINLGTVTENVWAERPELRERVGREWTKIHYQNHRRARTDSFIKEKIEIVDRLMSSGGYGHLILAGHPRMTRRLQKALPKHLQANLVGLVPGSARTSVPEIVATTLQTFVEAEERESRSAVEDLVGQIRTGGLAVAGPEACLRSLQRGQVDTLIMAKAAASEPAYMCTECGLAHASRDRPLCCPECAHVSLRFFDLKEEATRLAEMTGCQVELANKSDALNELGGIGCLLRYRLQEEYQEPASRQPA